MTLYEAIHAGCNVFLIGNGGSFANAAHIANDLLSCGVKAHVLDAAFLTATANDHGYENIFSRWLSVVGAEGDCLIALSGSGKSTNILNAIAVAEEKGMMVVKIFGAEMGQDMQAAEEYQLAWGHKLYRNLMAWNRPLR